MPKIVYYVAISLDGYISGPDEDISLYVGEGSGLSRYLSDLKTFETVIMGRNTYEFGYDYGLKPGQPAYPHMQHHIFSDTLVFKDPHPQVHVEKRDLERVKQIRDNSPTDVYLCGGGEFAGWLLDNQLIDVLKVKVSPVIYGDGIALFGRSKTSATFNLVDTSLYDKGLQISTYEIVRE